MVEVLIVAWLGFYASWKSLKYVIRFGNPYYYLFRDFFTLYTMGKVPTDIFLLDQPSYYIAIVLKNSQQMGSMKPMLQRPH